MTRRTATSDLTKFRNAFMGQAKEPTDGELATALGPSKTIWDGLVADLIAQYKLTREWNSYSTKTGWALRLKRGSRNVVYLSPTHRGFMASFALSDKAMQAARTDKFPEHAMKVVAAARKYAEGTAVRIVVSGAEEAAAVERLTKNKLDS